MAEKKERQRDFFNRLYEALPAGQGPDLLKELAGSLGIAATPQPAQEQQAAPFTPEAEGMEPTGFKKTPKQARIKSQGPYARPGEGASGTVAKGHGSRRPRRKEQPKGHQTTAARQQRPSSYEEDREAQVLPLRRHSEFHRDPIGMGPFGRACSFIAGATGSHEPAVHGTQNPVGFQGNAADHGRRCRQILGSPWYDSVDRGGGTRIRRYRGRPGGRTRRCPGHVSVSRTSGNEEELRSGWHRNRITECTRDGQGGFSPQGSLGRTGRGK